MDFICRVETTRLENGFLSIDPKSNMGRVSISVSVCVCLCVLPVLFLSDDRSPFMGYVSFGKGDRISKSKLMSISGDSLSDETLNRGPLDASTIRLLPI